MNFMRGDVGEIVEIDTVSRLGEVERVRPAGWDGCFCIVIVCICGREGVLFR